MPPKWQPARDTSQMPCRSSVGMWSKLVARLGGAPGPAFCAFCAGGLSDGADGYLARIDLCSVFGAELTGARTHASTRRWSL